MTSPHSDVSNALIVLGFSSTLDSCISDFTNRKKNEVVEKVALQGERTLRILRQCECPGENLLCVGRDAAFKGAVRAEVVAQRVIFRK